MRIGQFWRLLDFMRFLIIRFYCQKDSRYMNDTESMKGARRKKSVLRTLGHILWAVYSTLSIKA